MMALQKCVERTTAAPAEALMCGALRHNQESRRAKETNFSQFDHIIFWVRAHLWRGTSHEPLRDGKRKARRPLFIQEKATPYSASCSQGNIIMATGWLSSREQRCLTTSALRLWHFQRLQTLCTVVISHIRKHSLCWMTVTLTTEKNNIKNNTLQTEKRASMPAEAAQQSAH